MDYIFQIYDPENETNIEDLASGLREIKSINAIFKIDLNTFKDKIFTIFNPVGYGKSVLQPV